MFLNKRKQFNSSGYDFIIVARARAVGKTFCQIRQDIAYAMKKLGIIRNMRL